jgi:beta-1,2-mannosidase
MRGMPALSRRDWFRAALAAPALSAVGHAIASAAPNSQSPPQPSWTIGPFSREMGGEPILAPRSDTLFACPVRGRSVAWEAKDVFNPAAIVRSGLVHLIFRAQDTVGRPAGTSRLGLATSRDGIHFERRPTPVLYPDNDAMRRYEWEGGCEDPRVVETEGGKYLLTYTTYDGTTARLAVASSTDLLRWTKHGLAFQGGQFRDRWSKSGAIVCRREGSRTIAARIAGRYWMYWGDTDIFLATSENGLDWMPVERPGSTEGAATLASIVSPRQRRFDSALVEPGPPALLTADGILLLYNGANRRTSGDPDLPEMAYSGGQALFDPQDPAAIIGRATSPFITIRTAHEVTGQVGNVCFVEGLVAFNGRWLLYYGMGDSRIGVASALLQTR